MGNLAKQQAPLIDEIKRLTPMLDKLRQQQQPLLDTVRELPKKLDEIRQSQPPSDLIKQLKTIKDGSILTHLLFLCSSRFACFI